MAKITGWVDVKVTRDDDGGKVVEEERVDASEFGLEDGPGGAKGGIYKAFRTDYALELNFVCRGSNVDSYSLTAPDRDLDAEKVEIVDDNLTIRCAG